MISQASRTSTFKLPGEQKAMFSRLPTHTVQIFLLFTSLRLPNRSFFIPPQK